MCLARVTHLPNSSHQIDRDQLSRGERQQCRTNVLAPLWAAHSNPQTCARDISRRRRRSRRTWTVINTLGRRVGGPGGGWWTRTDRWTVSKAGATNSKKTNQVKRDCLNRIVRHCSEDKSETKKESFFLIAKLAIFAILLQLRHLVIFCRSTALYSSSPR